MFRIRHAARLTGLTPEVIRAWERRYGLLDPSRTDAGYRVYTSEDLDVLRGAKALVTSGQSIGDVARLPRQRLMDAGRAAVAAGSSVAPVQAPEGGSASVATEQQARAISGALDALAGFDRDAFELALFPVLGVGTLTPGEMCERVLLPLLHAVGDAWERGRLSVAAEHFGTSLVRSKILHLLDYQPRGAAGRRVVCACPDQEQHEGGLLAFAVHAAAAGWQVVYLGASTPLLQAIAAADRTGAAALALSLTVPPSDAELETFIEALRQHHEAKPQRALLLGGAAALAHRERFEAVGAQVAERVSVALPR